MVDIFKDIIPSILQTKEPVITEENEREYNPFVVNRALSQHYDCALYANQMNLYPNTDKLLQYHYYLNTIRSYKRPYQKWHKKDVIEDLDAIKEYYNYSYDKAKDALRVLSGEQLNEIKKKLDKGGINDKLKRSRRS